MNDHSAAALQLVAQAIANSRPVAVPPPPVYDGSDGSYPIDDFFAIFERYAEAIYGPKSRSWILVLPGFLGGEPRKALSALGTAAEDYDSVKLQIKGCCKVVRGLVPTAQEDFLQTSRRAGESLQVFVLRLRSMAAVAFGEEADLNAVVMPKLMLSLTPSVRKTVEAHLLTMNNPTIDTALPLIIALSSCMDKQTAQLDTVNSVKDSAGPTQQFHVSQMAAVRPDSQRLRCFACGEIGHFAAECPARLSNRGARRGPGHFIGRGRIGQSGRSSGRDGGQLGRGRGGQQGRGYGDPSANVCPFCGLYGHFMKDCGDFRKTMRSATSQERSGN